MRQLRLLIAAYDISALRSPGNSRLIIYLGNYQWQNERETNSCI